MQVTAIDERTSAVLDVIRWLAALAAAFSFALLLASLQARPVNDSRRLPALVRHPFNKFAADFSYTLYATHFPFIMFVIAASETLFGWGWHSSYSGDRELLLALLLVAATMVYAWLMFLAFESRTRQVYEWLKRGQQRLQGALAWQSQQKDAAVPGQVNEA